jgi:hypothetical protein
MSQTDHFNAGFTTLAKDAIDQFPDDAPWTVNGVAIPVNTIVNGGQNTDHFFPPETLEGVGELLEGKPIVKNFHELDGQAPADDVIGKVTDAGFQQGVGLVFEGEVTDSDIAQKVKQGYLDVSPTPMRSLGEFDDDMGAQAVERVVDFRDIAVVANGQPGAEVSMGSNPAVEALSMDALSRGFDTLQADSMTPPEQAQTNAQAVLDIREQTDAMTETGWRRANQLADGESLSEDVIERMAQFKRHQGNTEFENFSDVPNSRKGEDAENPWWDDNGTVAWFGWGGTAGVEWAVDQSEEMDSMSPTDALQGDMKTVAGVSFVGTREGKLDESEIDDNFGDHALYGDGENKSDYSYWVVDADGYLRKGNVESAWQLGCRGQCPGDDAHDSNLMELAQEFDTPPEFAQEDMDTNSDDESVSVVDEIEVVETNTENTVTLIEK